MVITLTVANESNVDFTYHGKGRYFLSQGKSVESANRNMHRHLCKEFEFFESSIDTLDADISDFLRSKFERWQDGEDIWNNEDSWVNQFSGFTFPRNNKAEIIEISEEMFDRIIEEW